MSPVDRADTEYGISMRVAKHGLEVSRPSHDETPKGDVGSHSHKMTTQPSGPGLNILDPEDTRQSGSAETTRSRIASPARVRQNAGGHAADDDNQVTSGAADVPSQTHFGSPCDDSKRHALLASGSDDLTAPHEGNEVEHHSPSSLQSGTEPRTRTGVSDRDVADLLSTLNRKHRERSRRVCTCCNGGSTCRVTFAPATELVIGGGEQNRIVHPQPVTRVRWSTHQQRFVPGRYSRPTILVGGLATPRYSERTRLNIGADHSSSPQSASGPDCLLLKPALKHASLTQQETTFSDEEEHLENVNPLAQVSMRTNEDRDVTIHSSDFLTCCDTGGRGFDVACTALSATASVGASPTRPSASIGTDVDGGRSTVEASRFLHDLPNIADESLEDPIGYGEMGTAPLAATAVHELPAPATDTQCNLSDVLSVLKSQLNAQTRRTLATSFQASIGRSAESQKHWTSLTKRKRGQIRRAVKSYWYVDTGANVHTCTDETAEKAFEPNSEKPSKLEIGGVVGTTPATSSGKISGAVKADDNSSVYLHHRDVHRMSGSTVNLLSASILTQDGIRAVFDTEEQGGSYLLLPANNGGVRRKVPLLLHNGIYLLELESLYPAKDEESMLPLLAHAISEEQSRPATYHIRSSDKNQDPVAYSTSADLRVWHERLGHIDTAAIRLIYKRSGISTMNGMPMTTTTGRQ